MTTRIEATLPDNRATALDQLADQLHLSRSQVVDEAIAFFAKVILEVKRGRRVVSIDPKNQNTTCELSTPSLTMIEWALGPREVLTLSQAELSRMEELIREPPEPTPAARKAAKRIRSLPADRNTDE